jgi:hypothetical protein
LTNNPTAATALEKAVNATLGSSNFTMVTTVNQQGPGIPPDTSNVREHFVYQAPNRVEEQSPGITEITVGSTLYVHTTLLGTTGARWGKLKVTSAAQSGSGQATEWLHFLLHQADVQQRSNVFRLEKVSTVPATPAPFPSPGGEAQAIAKVAVADGKVVSEHIVLSTAVARFALSISYSDFGTSPAVRAPPADDIALPCRRLLCPQPVTPN